MMRSLSGDDYFTDGMTLFFGNEVSYSLLSLRDCVLHSFHSRRGLYDWFKAICFLILVFDLFMVL